MPQRNFLLLHIGFDALLLAPAADPMQLLRKGHIQAKLQPPNAKRSGVLHRLYLAQYAVVKHRVGSLQTKGLPQHGVPHPGRVERHIQLHTLGDLPAEVPFEHIGFFTPADRDWDHDPTRLGVEDLAHIIPFGLRKAELRCRLMSQSSSGCHSTPTFPVSERSSVRA